MKLFHDHDGAEGIVGAFFDNLGRRVRAKQPDGTIETVQVVPRGGWFKRLYISLAEYDVRLLRATLGIAPDACFPRGRTYQRVKELLRSDECNGQLYDAVHSVVASMFARMAVRERGADGRARSEPLSTPSVETFAANALRIPRSHVSELASLSISYAMSQKLAALEAERMLRDSPWAMVVAADGGAFGGAYLWHVDGRVHTWQPVAVSLQSAAGASLVSLFRSLQLTSFGMVAFEHPQQVPYLFPLATAGHEQSVPRVLRLTSVPAVVALREAAAAERALNADAAPGIF